MPNDPIESLRNSQFFVGGSEDYVMAEKQNILLALTGDKPVSEATSGHWEATETGRQRVADDPAKIKAFLDSLGLVSRVVVNGSGTDATVSLRPEFLDEYNQAEDHAKAILFGYPATAVAAYGTESLMPFDEQEKIELKAGVNAPFRYSREYWQDELKIAQKWAAVVAKYGFTDEENRSAYK